MAANLSLCIYNKVTDTVTPIPGYSFDTEMEEQLQVVEQLTLLVRKHAGDVPVCVIIEEKLLCETKKLAEMVSSQMRMLAHENNYDFQEVN